MDLTDLQDLPNELLDSLELSEGFKTRLLLIQLLKNSNGLDIREILIGLYKLNGQIYKKKSIETRLVRMRKDKEIKTDGKRNLIYYI